MDNVESKTKRRVSEATLRSLLAGRGCAMESARELGEGMYNAAYLVKTDRGEYVMKIAPCAGAPILRQEHDIMHAEARVMELVAARAPDIPAPRLAEYREDGEYIWLLQSALPGRSVSSLGGSLGAEQAARMGRELGGYVRALHEITGERFGFVWNRETELACLGDRWSGTFAAIVENMLRDAEDRDVALPVPPAALRALVRDLAPALDEVAVPRLIHRDLWAGNILADPATGRVTGIIDWDRACFGDPLLDTVFAFTDGSMPTPYTPAFNEGYGRGAERTPGESARISLYSLYLYALMYIETYYRGYDDADAKRAYLAPAVKAIFDGITQKLR